MQLDHYYKENIFSVESEAELVDSFRDRDKRKLVLPSNLKFPMTVRSYLAWQESSGVYTYLVYKHPQADLPKGIVFKKTHAYGEPTGGLCNWCHHYGSSEELGMMSVEMNSKTSMGYFICKDLSCVENIEEDAARAGKNPEKNIDELYKRMNKLVENLQQYKPD